VWCSHASHHLALLTSCAVHLEDVTLLHTRHNQIGDAPGCRLDKISCSHAQHGGEHEAHPILAVLSITTLNLTATLQ
jgi:hypothetical protein